MTDLKLVPISTNPVTHPEGIIHVGRRYLLAEDLAMAEASLVCADPDLVIGGYRLTEHSAELVKADPVARPDHLYVWNTDAEEDALFELLRVPADISKVAAVPKALVCNRLILCETGLEGPALTVEAGVRQFGMNACFDLDWHTDCCSAELGAVELVESMRSIQFEDGESLQLLDTACAGGPVRYVPGDPAPRAVQQVAGPQAKGESKRHVYRVGVHQEVPETMQGRSLAGLTVLEKYTTYFMQCEDPAQNEAFIWVPLLAPVVWGWSIRVGRRTDGEWGILRRKLLMPTCKEGGLELPLWRHTSQSIVSTCS